MIQSLSVVVALLLNKLLATAMLKLLGSLYICIQLPMSCQRRNLHCFMQLAVHCHFNLGS